jgi:hypothetical protein
VVKEEITFPAIAMITLNSSALRAVDYDPFSRDMQIWFASGGPYTFRGVPPSIYQGLISAGSPGTYYNNHIRGRYR